LTEFVSPTACIRPQSCLGLRCFRSLRGFSQLLEGLPQGLDFLWGKPDLGGPGVFADLMGGAGADEGGGHARLWLIRQGP